MHIKLSHIQNCFFAIFLVVLCVDVAAESDDGAATQQREYVEGEILVKFRASVTAVDRNRVRSGVLSVRQVSGSISKLQVNQPVDQALEQLRDDPGVEYAQPNYIKRLQTQPNDAKFQYQWGLKNTGKRVPFEMGLPGVAGADISAEQAWQVTTGGSGVVIAVLDTGIDPGHPELLNVLWTNVLEAAGVAGVDDDGNGYVDDTHGWDMVNGDNRPLDLNGHGTQIAGIIAARADDGVGVAGVMWSASILPLQVFDANGVATSENIVKAIDYAVAQGVDIINASFGSYGFDRMEFDAISRANDAGVLFVAAACNDNLDNDDVSLGPACMPASYLLPNIISVAATNHLDQLSDFSNYGITSVDIAAPGENIISTELAFESEPVLKRLGFDLAKTISEVSLVGKKSCRLVVNQENTHLFPVDALSIYVWQGLGDTDLTKPGPIGRLELEDTQNYFDLSDFDGLDDLNIRAEPLAGGQPVFGPVIVNSILIECYSDNYDFSNITYSSGTSLASAYVTGVAGLVVAKQRGLSPQQIVDHLLESVDVVTAPPGLVGLIKSGGRINASKAVSGVLPVPVPASVESENGGGGVLGSVWLANLLIIFVFLYCSRRDNYFLERKPVVDVI